VTQDWPNLISFLDHNPSASDAMDTLRRAVHLSVATISEMEDAEVAANLTLASG
jgi:hypothetical protein